MFQKKLQYRKRFLGQVQQPEIQYMNIYHTSERRLSCFKDICHEEETSIFNQSHVDEEKDEEKLNNTGYFYGDATSYEQHLDKVLKQLHAQDVENKKL